MGGLFSSQLRLAKVVAAAAEAYRSPQGRLVALHARIRAHDACLGLQQAARLRRLSPEGQVIAEPAESPLDLPLGQVILGLAGASICLRKAGRSAELNGAPPGLLDLEEQRQAYGRHLADLQKPYNDPDLLSLLWVMFALRGWRPRLPRDVAEIELAGQFVWIFQDQTEFVLARAR